MAENIFIIMPAYNAGKTIERVFARMPAAIHNRVSRYVVVNDGSRDDTQLAIERLERKMPNLVGLRHDINRGYGAAEKTLLRYAVKEGADVAILLHSDGQYSPERIPAILREFEEDRADIVMGSRMLSGGALEGNMPFYKFVGNKALTAMENWAFSLKMAEYHSGFMTYNRRAMTEIPFAKLSDAFDFDLEMVVMAKVKGLRVREVAIPTIYADEKSHLNPVKYGMDVLGVIWDYKRGKYHAL